MTTDPTRVLMIVGSPRVSRSTRPMARWLEARLRDRDDLALDVVDLADVDLPEKYLGTPGAFSPISDRMHAADAFVILTPEYNRSFSGALKTAIDWHRHEWTGKAVTFVSYGGHSGGISAVQQLRPVFTELQAVTTRNTVPVMHPAGMLLDSEFAPDDDVEKALGLAVDELVAWAAMLRTARDARTRLPED